MADRPNFLCFVVDQMRWDHLGCAGNPVIQTPNLDRLAREGVHFTRAYCNNPLCMPSRATLFTGLTPRAHKVRTNGIPLDRRFPTILQSLAEAGYHTISVGKLHLNPYWTAKGVAPEALDPLDWPEAAPMWNSGRLKHAPTPYYGFQDVELTVVHGPSTTGDWRRWLRAKAPEAEKYLTREYWRTTPHQAEQCILHDLSEELHYNSWVAERSIDYLKRQPKDEPFFLWCSFPDPHHPYAPPKPYSELYDPADVVMPTRREGELDDLAPFFKEVYEKGMPLSGRFAPTKIADEQMREIIALTYGMVSHIDACIGRVLQVLEERGLADDTIVCFLSDHGDMMGDHWLLNKGPFHFEGLLKLPFIWHWPKRFARGSKAEGLASYLDFAPTILDLAGLPIPEGQVPGEVEAKRQLPPWSGKSLVPILTGESQAVREAALVENDEDYLGLKLRTLVTERYKLTYYAGEDFGELFDLQEDPGEVHNLWHDPAYSSLRADLLQRLLEEIVATDSVLPRRMCHA